MMMNRLLVCFSSLLIMMILCGCQSAEPESGDPPNIVFIFPDQWRLQALGFQQADPVLTPNLDRLAGEGAVVTHALSNHPMCSPYRGMLMTGKTLGMISHQ